MGKKIVDDSIYAVPPYKTSERLWRSCHLQKGIYVNKFPRQFSFKKFGQNIRWPVNTETDHLHR